VHRIAHQRGGAIVEFALVSIVLYLLLAGAIEFGRMMFDANALQDVARLAAREMAVAPIRANATFDFALTCDPTTDPTCLVNLRTRVFDPACLVVDLSDPAVAQDIDGYFAAMPVVNRALRTLMITEQIKMQTKDGEANMRFADSWVLRDGKIAIHFAGMVQHPDGSLA